MLFAQFFAQRIILEKITFKQVPSTLKPQVRELLVEAGLEFLIVE